MPWWQQWFRLTHSCPHGVHWEKQVLRTAHSIIAHQYSLTSVPKDGIKSLALKVPPYTMSLSSQWLWLKHSALDSWFPTELESSQVCRISLPLTSEEQKRRLLHTVSLSHYRLDWHAQIPDRVPQLGTLLAWLLSVINPAWHTVPLNHCTSSPAKYLGMLGRD